MQLVIRKTRRELIEAYNEQISLHNQVVIASEYVLDGSLES